MVQTKQCTRTELDTKLQEKAIENFFFFAISVYVLHETFGRFLTCCGLGKEER